MSEASKDTSSPDEYARRLAWSDEYTARVNARPRDLPLRCPCCGCKTLAERTAFEICEVCYWEDDGQDDGDADEWRGGPNGSLSLTEARANYLRFGACEASMVGNVRPPRPEELPAPRQAERGAAADPGHGRRLF
jgi:hypothetical protein